MNIRKTGIAAITLITALSAIGTAAHAQNPNRYRGGRPPFTGRNPGDRVSDQRMREASQRIQQAERQLRQALPIYDGNRVDAIQQAEIAQWEIKIGLTWDRMREQDRNRDQDRMPNFRKEREGRRNRNHSNDQVRRSNARLTEASNLLEDAQRLLERAQPDYGGHRNRAIEATRRAIQEIRSALRSV